MCFWYRKIRKLTDETVHSTPAYGSFDANSGVSIMRNNSDLAQLSYETILQISTSTTKSKSNFEDDLPSYDYYLNSSHCKCEI